MTARSPLPNRRLSETVSFVHDGQKYYGTLGFADQFEVLPRELFLDGGKPGSGLQAMCRDFAIVVSKALEHGTPIEELTAAVTRLDDKSAASAGGKLLDIIAGSPP